jgi:hypothetical protein
MKHLVLKEPNLRSEIRELQFQIDNLQQALEKNYALLEKKISVVENEKTILQNMLDEANTSLETAVKQFYDRKIIYFTRNEIFKKISEEFFSKYRSDISPVVESKKGEFKVFEFDANFLKVNTFSDLLKYLPWQHNSKKIKLLNNLKIAFLGCGILSIIMILFFEQPDGAMRYALILCMLFICFHLIWIYSRRNFFSEGEKESFYKKFYKKNVESYVSDQVHYLDSINDAPEEVKKLI